VWLRQQQQQQLRQVLHPGQQLPQPLHQQRQQLLQPLGRVPPPEQQQPLLQPLQPQQLAVLRAQE
jgi:hypothetical protein